MPDSPFPGLPSFRRSLRRTWRGQSVEQRFRPSASQWRAGTMRWRLSRDRARQVFAAVLASVFAISMIELMSRIDRFQIASSQQLANAGYLQGFERWAVDAEHVELQGMQAVLSSQMSGRSGLIRQRIDVPAGYYRISAEVRAAALPAHATTTPKVLLQLAARGQRHSLDAGVHARLYRSAGWRSLSALVHVPVDGAEFRVEFQGGGEFRLRNPRVTRLAELTSYRLAKGIFVSLIAIAVGGAACWMWRRRWQIRAVWLDPRRRRNLLLAGSPALLALLAALLPGAYLAPLTASMYAIVPDFVLQIVSKLPGRPLSQPSDVGHLLAFALIGLVIAWRCRGRALLSPVSMAVALALSIEALQTLTRDRTASYADVAVDVTGLVFGVLLGLALLHIRHARRVRTQQAAPPTFKFNSGDRQNYDIAIPEVKRRRRRKRSVEPID